MPRRAGHILVYLGLFLQGCSETNPEIGSTPSPAAEEAGEPRVENLFTLGREAVAAKQNEDWQAARDIYQRALDIAPGHPIVYERIAEVEIRLGLLDEALGHLDRMAELDGTTSAIDHPPFDQLVEQTGFAEIAARLRANGAPQKPAEVFVTFADNRLSPEGIAWDSRTGDLFTGSFLLNKIVRITPAAEVSDLGSSATDGLGAVLGMWVDAERRELWAAAGSTSMTEMTHPAELVRYSIDSDELVARYPAPDGDQVLLVNDVVVTADGTAWTTESLIGGLYRVSPGADRLELFLELPQMGFANGIAASADGGTIYIGHAEGLSTIDVATRKVERITSPPDVTLVSADGLSWADGSLVLVQNQPSLNNRVIVADLDAGGLRVTGIRQLPLGLPTGLEPYTSAVGEGFLYVTASPPIDPETDLTDAPPPAIVRVPL
jgi:hypothetical protein